MGRLLIDGYNVIRRDPALRELERRDALAARAELLRLLLHHSLAAHDVLIVYDGAPPVGERLPRGRAKILHSRAEPADALIAEICGPDDIVVTDDRGLAHETLRAGPRVWSVERLMSSVRPRSSPRRSAARREQKPDAKTGSYPRLRRFEVCSRCMFSERDDWVMLCEEDSAIGAPRNYREGW